MQSRRYLPALFLLFVGRWLRGADLRDRLAAAASAGRRRIARLAGRAPRHVHGRHVSGQPAAAADDIARRHHPLRVYAFLELGIGAIGLIVLFAMPLVGGIYTSIGGRGHRCSALSPRVHRCELVPAAADAPHGRDAARDVALGEDHARRRLVAGILLRRQHCRGRHREFFAGFSLLRVFDVAIATLVALAINVAVPLVDWPFAAAAPRRPADEPKAGRAPGAATARCTSLLDCLV